MEPAETGKGLLLLLLYDHLEISLFEEKLHGYGFNRIVSCTSSAEALEKLPGDDFSAAIVDIEPRDGQDGIVAGRKIRDDFHIPCIYISRSQDEKTVQGALETRPAAFLTQPVNWIELRMAIESAIFWSREKSSLVEVIEEQHIMFDEAPLPCHTMSADGRLIVVNKAWSEITGYTSAEVTGKNFNEFFQNKYLPIFDHYLTSLKQGDTVQPPEIDLATKNGKILTVTLSGKCHYNSRGIFIAIHCILHDITKIKCLQNKLEESEERFRILFEEAPLGYQSLAENGGMLYVNNTWCNLMGYSKDETEGKWFGEFLVPEDQERFSKNFSEFKRTGEAKNIEYRMIRKNSQEVHILIDGKVRYDEEGRYIQSHCILKDITAQKIAEQAHRKSEMKFRNLIESAGDIIYMLDPDLKYIYGNSRYLKRHGMTLEELIGKDYGDFHTEERKNEFKKEVLSVYETGNPFTYEYLSELDGKYFSRSVSPVINTGTNKIESITVISRDITGLKSAEQALRKRENEIRTITDNIPALVSYVDKNGCYRFANQQYEKWFGLSANQIIGKHYREILGEVVNKKIKNHVDQVLSGKRITFDDRLPYAHGDARWISAEYIPDFDMNGDVAGFYGLVSDITERKKAVQKLQSSEERYRKLADSITDIFFAMDNNLRYTFWNKASEKLMGISEKDAIGKHLREIFPDTPQTEKVEHVYQNVLLNREPQTFINEFTLGEKDFVFEISVYPAEEGISVFVKDITERRQLEEKLRESEAKSKAQYKGIPIPTYTWQRAGANFILIDYNDAAEAIADGHMNDFVGMELKEMCRDKPEIVRDVSLCFSEKACYSREILYQFSSGQSKYLAVKYAFVPPDLVLVHTEDITQRKKIETELNMSRQMLQTVLDNIPAAVFWKDRNSLYLGANRTFLDATGLSSSEEIAGKSDYDLPWNPELGNKYRMDDKRIMESGIPEFNIIEPLTLKEGTPAWARTNKVPLRNEDGNIMGILGTYEDITQLKKAEDDLLKSQAQLSNAMNIARLGYWEYDVATDLFAFDDHFYSIFRTTAGNVGGYSISSARYTELFVHPEDQHMVGEEIRKALETRDPDYSRQVEHRIIFAGGETGYIAVRFFIIKDDQGRTVKTFGANQDITDRKRTEKALEESEAMLRIINENISDIIWRIDSEARLTYISPSVERILGFRPMEIMGAPIIDFIAGEYQAFAIENIKKRVAQKKGDKQVYYEYEMVSKDGRRIPMEVSSTAIRDENGKLTGFAGVTRNISERKAAEKAMRESEARFRELFSHMSSGVAIYEYMADRDEFFFRDMNEAGLRIMQITDKKKFIGKTISVVAPGAKSMGLTDVMRKVMKSGKPGRLTASFYKDDRIELYVDNHVYRLPTGEIVAVFDDITERILAEQDIWRNYEEIKKLTRHIVTVREEERRLITRNLHDDLGQIMTAVKMDVSWIRNRMPESSEELKKRAESTLQIIDQGIHSIQRISSELRPTILDDLGLYEALKAHISEYKNRTNIEVSYKFPKREPLLVPGQEIAIFRIVQEALTNAVRHSGATTVSLLISKKYNNLEIIIGDNGTGIADDKIASTDSFGLIGIRERVLQWGGTITIRGDAGQGTIIKACIPLS
jgi:PAS domain S-box-containing protein